MRSQSGFRVALRCGNLTAAPASHVKSYFACAGDVRQGATAIHIREDACFYASVIDVSGNTDVTLKQDL